MSNLSWSVDVRTHAIAQVVEKLLSQPWDAAEKSGDEVPALKRQHDCVVCLVAEARTPHSVKLTIAGLFQMGFWKLHPMTKPMTDVAYMISNLKFHLLPEAKQKGNGSRPFAVCRGHIASASN